MKKFRKLVSVVLATVMVMSVISISVFADSFDPELDAYVESHTTELDEHVFVEPMLIMPIYDSGTSLYTIANMHGYTQIGEAGFSLDTGDTAIALEIGMPSNSNNYMFNIYDVTAGTYVNTSGFMGPLHGGNTYYYVGLSTTHRYTVRVRTTTANSANAYARVYTCPY